MTSQLCIVREGPEKEVNLSCEIVTKKKTEMMHNKNKPQGKQRKIYVNDDDPTKRQRMSMVEEQERAYKM